MDSTFHPVISSINGIDLSDYFVDKSSYNPVVYIHKRYLSEENNRKNPEKTMNVSEIQNKSQHTYRINDENCKTHDKRDSLIEQTIKFAKDIIPLTIPPSTNIPADPVFYTIKASKNSKRKHEPCEHKSNNNRDVKFNNEKVNRKIGPQREIKRNKGNTEDTVSRSSPNNTIDDFNENRSLCCSSSEMSEQKLSKEVHENKKKRKEIRKIIPSETFEAFASEYVNTNESNIKIHLMNEKEKQLLCESISVPIAKTIRELFSELNNPSEVRHDILHIHKSIENQSYKLDNILEKLTRIENKIDKLTNNQNDATEADFRTLKTSKLEEIGKDILKVKNNLSSEEELAQVDFLMQRRIKTTSATSTTVKDDIEDDFSKGENIPELYKASTSHIGINPKRPNRIPARFCWTDTVKKN